MSDLVPIWSEDGKNIPVRIQPLWHPMSMSVTIVCWHELSCSTCKLESTIRKQEMDENEGYVKAIEYASFPLCWARSMLCFDMGSGKTIALVSKPNSQSNNFQARQYCTSENVFLAAWIRRLYSRDHISHRLECAFSKRPCRSASMQTTSSQRIKYSSIIWGWMYTFDELRATFFWQLVLLCDAYGS